MKNFIQPGDAITVAAPTGGVTSGDGVLVDALFGIAAFTAAAGADVELQTRGVFDLPKAAGALTVGKKVYWDATAKNVTATASGNTLIGVVTKAAASGDALARVRLNGTAV
jgi:predicted RecA/RadA family phage recombinase